MIYTCVYIFSFFGTKYLGLERTILAFRKIGLLLRKRFRFNQSVETIENRLERSLHKIPLSIKCLDQAVAAWFWLNLNGHPASLKIGLSLTPLESHAWVALSDRIFVRSTSIPDLKVVAEYGAWDEA